ncbi:hypothetical protein E9531_06965 [Lampropedia puyangensis]|uniref:Uncharacterized protein n=1 Tax=Lampropedia puyangensis TaxID=1330072 RepID=A0A4S8F991_9BURK|nr:hypothetical protein [Lampropedia puyangensis]THU02834.1 hypothetical protein E9531_06965 [Lampropedia puyangensis]
MTNWPLYRVYGGPVAVSLLFAVLAWAMRFHGGYPICHNDEVNWMGIAEQLDSGVHWPVSGPAFIETVRFISANAELPHAHTLSALGIGCVFLSILLLWWGYRKLGLVSPASVLMALVLSSYFWAPLMESRPQQWGQMLVFAGIICAWQWLHRQGGWMFFLIVPVIAVLHILSHAILIFLCAVLVFVDCLERRPLGIRHVLLGVYLLISLGIYLLPHGPYAAMLMDLQQVHLKRFWATGNTVFWVLGGGAILFLLCLRYGHWRPSWNDAIAQAMLRNSTAMALSLMCIVLTALAMQAYLLPAAAWMPYKGSLLRFVFVQLGNVLFAAFFVVGIFGLVSGVRADQFDVQKARVLIVLLIGFGALSGVAIAASWWLLDTNWFLRVLNYGVFFAAIICSIGVRITMQSRPIYAIWGVLGAGVLASIIAVIRPPQLLGC